MKVTFTIIPIYNEGNLFEMKNQHLSLNLGRCWSFWKASLQTVKWEACQTYPEIYSLASILFRIHPLPYTLKVKFISGTLTVFTENIVSTPDTLAGNVKKSKAAQERRRCFGFQNDLTYDSELVLGWSRRWKNQCPEGKCLFICFYLS